MEKNQTTTQDTSRKCEKCYKVRYIESKEKYEEIRNETPIKCFECKRCEEPEDVDVNFDSRAVRWFMDRHGIPKIPQGLKRILLVRESGEKADVYYETPQQKRLKSVKEVAKFIQENEQFKDIKIEEVSFATPKLMTRTKSKDVAVADNKT